MAAEGQQPPRTGKQGGIQMFVVTFNRAGLRRVGVGLMCLAVLVCSIAAGRTLGARSVAAAAPAAAAGRIENSEDIRSWFTGYGVEIDPATVRADKVKIPRKWDESFAAFHAVVQQSGMDLTRCKGRTVEKWMAQVPARSTGESTCWGVLLVYRKKAVGAYLLEKPSGTVMGLQELQAAMAEEAEEAGQPILVSAEDFSGDWGEEHEVYHLADPQGEQAVSAEPDVTLLPDAQGFPVE